MSMIFLAILCFLLTAGLGISIYGNFNLTNKYEALEEISIKNEEFIIAMRNRVLSQQSYLRQLDKNGAFQSDDEVGYFFKELKKIINDIYSYFEDTPPKDDDDDTTPRERGFFANIR